MTHPPRLRTAVEIADDLYAALTRINDSMGATDAELDALVDTIREHQARTRPHVPEWAIQHGAQRLYNGDDLPPRQLAEHMAACLATAESVLTGVAEAGYLIARPPAPRLCTHGLPRCLRCVHDGTATP
jgi:hypothetical protein